MPFRSLSTTLTICAQKLSTNRYFVQNLSISCVESEKNVEKLSTRYRYPSGAGLDKLSESKL